MSASPARPDLPLVSVILPAYNCGPYLAEALESVINQTYRNLEIIVVDDHSSDNTWEVIQKFAKQDRRIMAFRNDENLKVVGTLNRAVHESHGKYLARMDGDDVRELGSIQHQVYYLEAHPETVVVGGAAEICDIHMKRLNDRYYPVSDEAIRKKIFRYSPFCHATIVMRADALEKDPYKVYGAEDYDLYFRLGKAGNMANLNEVTYRVRTYKTSITQTTTRLMEKTTLGIRLKATRDYGYTMTFVDKAYFAAQYLTMYIMPPGLRFWLFNKLRAFI